MKYDQEVYEALAENERNQPVAWMFEKDGAYMCIKHDNRVNYDGGIPLYTHPADLDTRSYLTGRYDTSPVKELTDEEILSLTGFKDNPYDIFIEYEKEDLIEFARAILRKAQEK